jgi:hypothetical protein
LYVSAAIGNTTRYIAGQYSFVKVVARLSANKNLYLIKSAPSREKLIATKFE